MKSVLKIVYAAAVLFAVAITGANAQTARYDYQALSVPAYLANTTTNLATPPTIGALKQQNVAISTTIKPSASIGATNIYTFQKSVDSVNWDAVNTFTITNWVTSATANTVTANVSMQGYGYARLYSINVATSSGNVTNLSVSYGIKTYAP